MKTFSFGLMGVFLSALSFAATADTIPDPVQDPKTPGIFDTYVLSMSYENDFCAATPTSASCGALAVDGMTLHGLWPDRNDDPKNTYQYCGVSESWVNKYRWCSPEIDVSSQFAPGELTALSSVMPGVATCLYNHEWFAHGTCSADSVSDYFENALTLATRFRVLSSIQELISSSAGQTIDLSDIYDAMTEDLGAKAAKSVRVICRYSKKTAYFSQIDIALDRKKFMDFPADDSLAHFKPEFDKDGKPKDDNSNCPAKDIIVSP